MHRPPSLTGPAQPAGAPVSPAPVRCAADAVAVVALALHAPPVDETICFLLDDDGVGGVVIAVEGTAAPDDVLEVVARVAAAADGTPTRRLVVASVRPQGSVRRDDRQRWRAIVDTAGSLGVEVVEWLVVDHERRVLAPRALAGDPMPWPAWPDPDASPPGAAAAFGLGLSVIDPDGTGAIVTDAGG